MPQPLDENIHSAISKYHNKSVKVSLEVRSGRAQRNSAAGLGEASLQLQRTEFAQ